MNSSARKSSESELNFIFFCKMYNCTFMALFENDLGIKSLGVYNNGCYI